MAEGCFPLYRALLVTDETQEKYLYDFINNSLMLLAERFLLYRKAISCKVKRRNQFTLTPSLYTTLSSFHQEILFTFFNCCNYFI